MLVTSAGGGYFRNKILLALLVMTITIQTTNATKFLFEGTVVDVYDPPNSIVQPFESVEPDDKFVIEFEFDPNTPKDESAFPGSPFAYYSNLITSYTMSIKYDTDIPNSDSTLFITPRTPTASQFIVYEGMNGDIYDITIQALPDDPWKGVKIYLRDFSGEAFSGRDLPGPMDIDSDPSLQFPDVQSMTLIFTSDWSLDNTTARPQSEIRCNVERHEHVWSDYMEPVLDLVTQLRYRVLDINRIPRPLMARMGRWIDRTRKLLTLPRGRMVRAQKSLTEATKATSVALKKYSKQLSPDELKSLSDLDKYMHRLDSVLEDKMKNV